MILSGDKKDELGGALLPPNSQIPNYDLGFCLDKQELRLRFSFGGICPTLGPNITSDFLML